MKEEDNRKKSNRGRGTKWGEGRDRENLKEDRKSVICGFYFLLNPSNILGCNFLFLGGGL